MLEVLAGVTSISPVGHFQALDLTLEQWEASKSFQQRRGMIRFDLESSLWLERGEMFGGNKLDAAAAPSEW